MRTTAPIVASILVQLCSAFPNLFPEPTQPSQNEAAFVFGFSPRPTAGPNLEFVKARGLLEKRASNSLLGYVASDRTCGFISGSVGNVVQCSTGSTCVALAPFATNPGAVGCCDSSGENCYFNTRCFNRAEVLTSSSCDQACQSDVNVHLCTASASPFCFAYTWADISVTSWGCVATAITTRVPVSFTFNGEPSTDNRVWSPLFDTTTATVGAANTVNPIQSGLSTAQANSTSTTSIATSSTPVPCGSNCSGGGGGGGKTNVGAIVGGVVGGIAVLAIAAVAAFFLITRARRRRNALDGGVGGAGAPPPMAPVGGGPSYASASPGTYNVATSHNPISPAVSTLAPSSLGGAASMGRQSYYAPDGKPLSGAYQQSERTSVFSEGTGVTGSSPPLQHANMHNPAPPGGVNVLQGAHPPIVHEIG